MQPEYSLPLSQKPNVCSYIDHINSAHVSILFIKVSILILTYHLRLGLPSGLFLEVFFHLKSLRISSLSYVPHVSPFWFISIWSPE